MIKFHIRFNRALHNTDQRCGLDTRDLAVRNVNFDLRYLYEHMVDSGESSHQESPWPSAL